MPDPGLQSQLGIASARDTKPRMSVNKACKLQAEWHEVNITEPCFIKSLATTPSVLWYIDGDAPPTADRITETSLYPGLSGLGYFSHPGRWWFYFVQSGSSAVQECYIIQPVTDPLSAKIFMDLAAQAMQAVDLRKWGAAAVAAATGVGTQTVDEAAKGPLVRAQVAGLDTSVAAGSQSQVIQARTTLAGGTLVLTLYRLLVDAMLRGYDENNSTASVIQVGEEIAATGRGPMLTEHARGSAYYQSRRGRKFRVTDEGASVTASNGFTATAPRFTLEAGGTKELIIRKIRVSCLAAGTTNLRARVILDPDARYSSGGTSGTVGARNNENGGSSATGGYTFHYGGITATATDADEREMGTECIVNVTGNYVEFLFEDGLIVPASGTLLIYVYDAGATGTAHITIEGEEADVQ